MYLIEKDKKKIKRMQECDFSSIGVKERQDIEEWVEKNPEILDEDLLIIQKEFDGFDDTNERLDLLALDVEGNIVVIELKRDDSGTDVNWQAIKYAAYCSTLNNDDILEIYSDYLGKVGVNSEFTKAEASKKIAEFLGTSEDDLSLNAKQRIILVTKQYRKEVLATVMWLLDNDIDVKCVRIQPYKDENTGSLYLIPTVILPPPNTEDYRIKKNEIRREQEARKKRSKFNFGMVDIQEGAELVFSQDENIKAKVVDDHHIEYNGEITSLSRSAQKILNTKYPVSGTASWKYEGETLDKRRRRFKPME
jgi:hypothetical protein